MNESQNFDVFQIYCNECKKSFNSNQAPCDFGHFKSFLRLPKSMVGSPIVAIKYFGANRKVIHVYNETLKKDFIYKIYYGAFSEEQQNALGVLRGDFFEHKNLSNINGPIEMNDENSEISLRFEHIPETLMDFVKKTPAIQKKTFAKYFVQICEGLKYLHENRLIHGYLELDSIFIQKQAGKEIIKIGGLDKTFCEEDLQKMDDIEIGNKNWMCPEVIQGNTKGMDLKKIDVWNLGIIMFQFLTKGKNPFQGENLMKTQTNIVQKNITQKEYIDQSAMKIIINCLNGMTLDLIMKDLDALID